MGADLGLLLIRVVVGLFLAGHGAQKLVGWFGGPGFTGTTALLGSHLRFRPAVLWAALACITEVVGGLSIALGLATPLGALAVVAAMAVAVGTHWPKVWATERGLEYPLVLAAVGGALGLLGPGRFSLDTLLGLVFTPYVFAGGLVPTLLAAVIPFATRVPAPDPIAATADA